MSTLTYAHHRYVPRFCPDTSASSGSARDGPGRILDLHSCRSAGRSAPDRVNISLTGALTGAWLSPSLIRPSRPLECPIAPRSSCIYVYWTSVNLLPPFRHLHLSYLPYQVKKNTLYPQISLILIRNYETEFSGLEKERECHNDLNPDIFSRTYYPENLFS